jgi:hypothetical protein
MKGKLLALLFLSSLLTNVYSQREISEDAPWTIKDRAYAGIGFGGLSFGNRSGYGQYFSIGAGLLGGYMLTRNLSTGVGFEYQYTTYSEYKLKMHVYGGYPFIRYNIKNFFVQFDYDLFWLKVNTKIPNADSQANEERFFGGLGYFGTSNGRTFMNFLVSYDFLYTSSNLFGSPVNTRLFFTF